MFGFVLLVALAVLHLYVFARTATVPWIRRRVPRRWVYLTGGALWLFFALARTAGHGGTGPASALIEFLGMSWMGCIFLAFAALIAADILTGFGFILRTAAPLIRGWALLLGICLSAFALIQGFRQPAVVRYEAGLTGLPAGRDGTVIAALSDLHLGSQLGERWLEARVEQVLCEKPDLIVLLGDIVEGHGASPGRFLPALRRLKAPLGVWAVTGNHEFHHGAGNGMRMLEEAGFRILRDRWAEVAPGLLLAGVDDLTSRRRAGESGDPVAKALAGRPAGGTVFLSHTPWNAEEAARLGAGLMLSGHTHGGQIWPFGEITRLEYPLLGGRYQVGGMTVLVCRGTGLWGPRMRLWRRGEILRVTLRAEAKPP